MANIRRSDAYRAVADICDALGVRHEIVTGRKHAKVRFLVEGKPIQVVVSISPSDRRVYLNSRASTLRMLRQAGVAVPEGV